MILFRADGNARVGLGHVMRCLSLADAFQAAGETCRFLLADGGAAALVRGRGHDVTVLDTAYDAMETELGRMEALIREEAPRALVVDSYFVTAGYLSTLRAACDGRGAVLAYVDDVLAFPYDCHVLLNYNIYADEQAYRALYGERPLPRLLLGTAYAPLRREFRDLPRRTTRPAGRDILVSTGGADTAGMAAALARAASGDAYRRYRFRFLVGAMSDSRAELEALAAAAPGITLHSGVTDMAGLMGACDAAISAAGSTLYELCATQTPTVTYVVADNQIPGADGFARRGILRCAGDVRQLGREALAERCISQAAALAEDADARSAVSARMAAVVDGRGASRVAQSLLHP